MAFLDNYPKLLAVTEKLDSFLRRTHPLFFQKNAERPGSELKAKKVIHDSIWGTFDFSWRELALLDTPLLQRLRDIQQVGLAYQVYPSARHSRLEHSLGVLVMASRIFDCLVVKHRSQLRECVKVVYGIELDQEAEGKVTGRIEQLKQELRLAALLHDIGHSLFSHASERAFGNLLILQEAAEELSDFAGKKKGAGEVLSFCFSLTPCIREWLGRATAKLHKEAAVYDGPIEMENVALIIIGRSKHPNLQFLGDIVSSDIDADKLDYLLRDSTSAGLPLRYDVDMYLYSAQLDLDVIPDGDGALERLYTSFNAGGLNKMPAGENSKYPFYEGYRLVLPKRAMHVLEQIVICKMMLYSYVYHHPKVRAAEGLLERALNSFIEVFREKKKDEWTILDWFLEASDSEIRFLIQHAETEVIKSAAYRIVNRILPREVFRLSASEAAGPQKVLLSGFLNGIRDKQKGPKRIIDFETALGEELKKDGRLKNLKTADALLKAGVWLDVPRAPKFEDTQQVVSRSNSGRDQASGMFPVHAWQQAYTSYRCYVRIYAHSEYGDIVKLAARKVMKATTGIEDENFYKSAERVRF
jgi:uncharacterized protein